MIWVIATNSNTCRIYDYQKSPAQITLLKEISHPENKLKDVDLVSDKSGHYKTDKSTRGAYAQHTDPKENLIENFSREIAKELEHGRNKHSYEKLIVIAPPHMTGLLLQHINKHVKDAIVKNVEKDIHHLNNDKDLLEFLHDHAQYTN